MVEKKKTSAAGMVFLVACVVLGAIIGLWLGGRAMRPEWQKTEDEEIAFQKKEGTLESYMLTRFVMALRPDGQTKIQSYNGEAYSYKDLYDYASEVTGIVCEKLADYAEDIPHNQMARCYKK